MPKESGEMSWNGTDVLHMGNLEPDEWSLVALDQGRKKAVLSQFCQPHVKVCGEV